MKKRIDSLKKQLKKFKKKHRVGFTLVELLAVIVVLGIIMVVATPSVLSTIDVAKKKSFISYIEKVATKGQSQYLLDLNMGLIPSVDDFEVLYDIETDLDLGDTGKYKGMYVLSYCPDAINGGCWHDDYDQDEREGVLLYNDEFFYGGFLDKGVPKESDIFSISDLSAEVQTMLKNKNLKEFYGYNESLRWCIGEKYVFDGGRDASGNKYGVLAHTTYLPDKYDLNGNCKGENPAYFYWTY